MTCLACLREAPVLVCATCARVAEQLAASRPGESIEVPAQPRELKDYLFRLKLVTTPLPDDGLGIGALLDEQQP